MLWATVSAEETCRLGKGRCPQGSLLGRCWPSAAAGHRVTVGRGLADEAASVRSCRASPARRLGLSDLLPAATASGKAALLAQLPASPWVPPGRKRPHLPQCWILCPAAACVPGGAPRGTHACGSPPHTHTSGPGSTRSRAQSIHSQAYTLRQVYATGAQRAPQIQNCRHVLTSTHHGHT